MIKILGKKAIFFSSLIFTFLIFSISLKADAIAAEQSLKVAITPVLVERNIEVNKKLIEYIGEKIKMPVDIIQRKTYQEINDLIERQQVDIAFICTLPYIIGKEKFGMELLAVPKTRGRPYYYSYTIVHKDSNARSIEDLRGKLFAYPDPLSNSGSLYPKYRLAKAGYSHESFFKKWILTYSHAASIEAVSDGFVDGANVDSYVYDLINILHPELTGKTKIIETSPPFGFTPVVMRKNLPADLKRKLQLVFLQMNEDAAGKKILKDMLLDGFIKGDDSLFGDVLKMYHYMNSINHKQSVTK